MAVVPAKGAVGVEPVVGLVPDGSVVELRAAVAPVISGRETEEVRIYVRARRDDDGQVTSKYVVPAPSVPTKLSYTQHDDVVWNVDKEVA